MVMLSTANLQAQVDCHRPSRKLTPKFIGPFQVLQVVSTNAYKLELPASLGRLHPVFHVSLLKKHIPSTPEFQDRITPPSPILFDLHSEPEFEVECILDKRIVHWKARYLVKWKGFSLHNATWKPFENLTNFSDLLQAFEATF